MISTIDCLYMKVYIDSLYMSSKGKSVVQYARKIERKTYLFHKNENNTCETVQKKVYTLFTENVTGNIAVNVFDQGLPYGR